MIHKKAPPTAPLQRDSKPEESASEKQEPTTVTATTKDGKEKEKEGKKLSGLLSLEELALKEDEKEDSQLSEQALNDPIFKSFSGRLEDIDNFEKMVENLGKMRSNAKLLPDKERREFAASVALSFLKQLGEGGDFLLNDEGDDDDE
jgi:hypothetical protein